MKLKPLLIAGIALLGITLWLNPSSNEAKSDLQTIAITQIVDHPSLNEARKGVVQALQDAGLKEGENIKIVYQTPQGNLSVAAQIAKSYTQLNPDVIVAISTPSAQVVLASNQTHLPVVFSSVTDPIAAKLISRVDHPGGDITGTMESPPIPALLALCYQLVPSVKTIGVIYNPGEANSVKSVEMLEKYSKVKVIKVPLLNSTEISQAVNSLINEVDVIILPTDNTVWSALDKLLSITTKHGIPVLTTDPDSVKKGVTVALGYAQYDIGYDAGKKVVRILQGEKPGDIPVTVPAKQSLYINRDIAKKMGIVIPDDMLKKADMILSFQTPA